MENTVEKNHVRPVASAGPVLRAVAGVVLALLALVVLAGCDKATKPKDVKYNLYVGATHLYTSPEDSSFNRIYIYDADSLTLIDSIFQAHFIDDLAVSPDGRWLYVIDFTNSRVPRTLWKIDARTKRVMWSRSDYRGSVRILANGKLLLVGNSVLRSEDGTLMRHLNDSLLTMYGPVSGTRVAAASDSVVRVVDAATGEVSGRFVAHLSSGVPLEAIFTARLHPDGRRVLAIGLYGSVYDSWFVVGDIETGQTLSQYRIYRPMGEIAISNDGNLAAITDPGAPVFGESGILHIIDLRTLSLITPTPHITGSQVRFLPGDRKIVTAPTSDPGLWDSGPMEVVDLATLTLERTIWPTGIDSLNPPNIGGLGVGPRQ